MHQFSSGPLFLIFIVLIVTLSGCDNRNYSSEENSPETLDFNVDTTLLSPAVIDSNLKITYSAPAEWNAISQETHKSIISLVANNVSDSQNVNIRPVHFYAADSIKGVLTVSLLQFLSSEGYVKKISDYKKLLSEKFKKNNIKDTEYLKNGIHITQFLVQLPDWIIFKLVFKNTTEQVIEFDYIAERDYYLSAIKAIESSIGSIKLTHNNQQ